MINNWFLNVVHFVEGQVDHAKPIGILGNHSVFWFCEMHFFDRAKPCIGLLLNVLKMCCCVADGCFELSKCAVVGSTIFMSDRQSGTIWQ